MFLFCSPCGSALAAYYVLQPKRRASMVRRTTKEHELSEIHDVNPLVAVGALTEEQKLEWIDARLSFSQLGRNNSIRTKKARRERYIAAQNVIRGKLRRARLDSNGIAIRSRLNKTVIRFWMGQEKLPDLEVAKTWSYHGFKQKVYTDHPNFPKFAEGVQIIHYDLLAEHPEFGPAAPQHYKDYFQFHIVDKEDGWFVDFDFALINPKNLPRAKVVLNSELGKITGGRKTAHLLKDGTHRLHLGISKFSKKHDVAKAIAEMIHGKLCKSKRPLCKSDSNWITFTTIATQKMLSEHGLLSSIVQPIVLNPWPHWLGDFSNVGSVKFGTPMPSIEETTDRMATLSVWEGFDFPRWQILNALNCFHMF